MFYTLFYLFGNCVVYEGIELRLLVYLTNKSIEFIVMIICCYYFASKFKILMFCIKFGQNSILNPLFSF